MFTSPFFMSHPALSDGVEPLPCAALPPSSPTPSVLYVRLPCWWTEARFLFSFAWPALPSSCLMSAIHSFMECSSSGHRIQVRLGEPTSKANS